MNRIPFPLNDGGAIGSYNFVRGYAEAGCSVQVLAMNTAKHFVERHHLESNLLKHASLDEVYIDNRITPLGAILNLFKSESYVTERFKSKDFEKRLIAILKENRFDVVHIDGLPSALYTDVVRQYSDALISYRAHNVEHYIWKRIAEKENNPLKKWYLKLQANRLMHFEKTALEKMDVVMTISKEDDEIVKQFYQKRNTMIVPAGIDVPEEIPQGNKEVIPLFFIGSFDWMPNTQGLQWFFNEVWPKLVTRYPQLSLLIAGKKMPESFRNLNLHGVKTLGEVRDARDFIISGGVMIVPVISGSGIRIKIVEAMALGKCIVATTIAAEGLGLTDGVNVLIADTPEQFVEKLGNCLDEKNFHTSIAKNAHRFALENFQNSRIILRLVNYYQSKAIT